MKTKIITLTKNNPDNQKLKIAAKAINDGKLVAFPTETVYGLGANAFDTKAIKNIFKVKGRPQDNPLIVHISDISQLLDLAKEVPLKAIKTINVFWPGPLTIVVKKKKVPSIVTANLDTVAIRMPKNKIALDLIKFAKTPIVAPSANLSKSPSPTIALHVINDLFNKVDVIVDGGACKIGIESTVVDFSSKTPTILRPGAITKEALEKIIGPVKVGYDLKTKTPKSPGQKYKHYSPKAFVYLVNSNNFYKEANNLIKRNISKKIGVIFYKKNNCCLLSSKNIYKKPLKDNKDYAKNLFKYFRYFDQKGCDIIICEKPKQTDIGVAIQNRLKKASSCII